jgi:hypothetical protein
LELKNNELFSVHVKWLSPMENTSSFLVNHLHNGIFAPINDTNNIPICLGTSCHEPFEIGICYNFLQNNYIQLLPKYTYIMKHSLWEKKCFVTSLATQIFSCPKHLQFIIFIHCECYWINCMNYKIVIHYIYIVQLIAIQSKHFAFNYYATPL